MSSQVDILPLSLQDTCMLQITLRLEEFPADTLSLLPAKIRSKLILGLSYADRLHLDELSDRDRVRVRQKLLHALLYNDPFSLVELISLHITENLALFDQLEDQFRFARPAESSILKHISECCRSLDHTVSPRIYVGKNQNVLIPTRFLKYTLDKMIVRCYGCPSTDLVESLIQYCGLTSTGGKM